MLAGEGLSLVLALARANALQDDARQHAGDADHVLRDEARARDAPPQWSMHRQRPPARHANNSAAARLTHFSCWLMFSHMPVTTLSAMYQNFVARFMQ